VRQIVENELSELLGDPGTPESIYQSAHRRGFVVEPGFLLFMIFLMALPVLQAQSSSSGSAELKRETPGQTSATSGIAGTIKDPQGFAVPGALVTLTDLAINKIWTTHSDEQGVYRFSALPAAAYTIEASAKGFKAMRIQGIKISTYAMVHKDIELSLGESSQIVEVTANRDFDALASPTVAALPESVQIQATVLTTEEIEAIHPQSVWDVLQQVPGMEVTYQGRQHLDFSSMRGASYRVILDGIYLSQTDRLLASLPADIIESMTVIRDATALSLGPLTSFGGSRGASNQGFIVIKTKRATKLSGGFSGKVGTFGDVKGTIYQGAKFGSFDYNVAATYANYDGKDRWYNASHNGSIALRSGFSKWGFNTDVLYYASRGMREMQWGEVLLPTCSTKAPYTCDYSKVGTIPPNPMSMPYMFSSMIGVNVTRPWSDSQTTTFQYAYNRLDVDTRSNSYTVSSPQNTREQNYSLRHAISFKNNNLTLGGQFLRYEAPTGQAPTNTGQKEGMLGLYVQDEHHLFGNKLILDGGIRSDKKYYFNSPTTGKPMDQWAKSAYTVSLGGLYKLSSVFGFSTRFGYSESGLSSDQISANGKPLPAEKRFRYEAGLVGNVRPYLKPFLTLYLYDTANQKVSSTGIDPNTGKTVSYYIDPATGEEITFVTTSNVITRGAELGISGKIKESWNYSMSYSYLITDNLTQNQSMSHHLVNSRLGYRFKNFFANLNMNYVGPKYMSSSPGGVFYLKMADYSRVDANAGFNFKIFDRATKIGFFGRNLGNSHYFTRYVTGAYKDVGLQYGMDLSISFF
jgi:outer membrane receptor for ferrienterochelin and colicin